MNWFKEEWIQIKEDLIPVREHIYLTIFVFSILLSWFTNQASSRDLEDIPIWLRSKMTPAEYGLTKIGANFLLTSVSLIMLWHGSLFIKRRSEGWFRILLLILAFAVSASIFLVENTWLVTKWTSSLYQPALLLWIILIIYIIFDWLRGGFRADKSNGNNG